jgi:hypothetical protein
MARPPESNNPARHLAGQARRDAATPPAGTDRSGQTGFDRPTTVPELSSTWVPMNLSVMVSTRQGCPMGKPFLRHEDFDLGPY